MPAQLIDEVCIPLDIGGEAVPAPTGESRSDKIAAQVAFDDSREQWCAGLVTPSVATNGCPSAAVSLIRQRFVV